MYGLKSAILAIFQKLADWLDWPCPVSAALQNCSQDFFFSFIFSFSFIFLHMKPLSEVTPGLLVIQIQIQAVWVHIKIFSIAFFYSQKIPFHPFRSVKNLSDVSFERECRVGLNFQSRYLLPRHSGKSFHLDCHSFG